MKTYLLVHFVTGILATIIRFCYLSWSDYPREISYSRANDMFLFVVGVGFLAWASYLLFV